MYESLMERENVQARAAQFTNDRAMSYSNDFSSRYSDRAYMNNVQNIQNVTPYMANPTAQNYYYTNTRSDNINTSIPPQQLSSYVQSQAAMYQQAPVYQPTYEDYQQQYNNVRVNAQSYPTNYYYQQSVNNAAYAVQNQVQAVEYEKVEPAKGKTKVKNKMTKALIAVYFFIIAVCAALILINLIGGASASEAVASSTSSEIVSSEIQYFENTDGVLIEAETTPQIVDYKYDVSTNWFDKFCDSLGKKLG